MDDKHHLPYHESTAAPSLLASDEYNKPPPFCLITLYRGSTESTLTSNLILRLAWARYLLWSEITPLRGKGKMAEERVAENVFHIHKINTCQATLEELLKQSDLD